MEDRKRKYTCDETYVVIIEYGGDCNCTNNMWLVPVSLIESLPQNVMSLLKELHTFHVEDTIRSEEMREKFDYIGLLLGLEDLEFIEDAYKDSSFFSKVGDLKAVYNVFDAYRIGCREKPVFTFPESKRPAHIFLRNSICI